MIYPKLTSPITVDVVQSALCKHSLTDVSAMTGIDKSSISRYRVGRTCKFLTKHINLLNYLFYEQK